jgi:hypothetical protein
MLEVGLGATDTYTTTIFDIYLKTFTTVQSSTDQLIGAPFLEICKANDPVPLYAFPTGFYGSGVAKVVFFNLGFAEPGGSAKIFLVSAKYLNIILYI